ncbi:MarR family transcriptional regulator [Acholeplasma sp. OttesenSCG-928-E16]|nr:MarR family transcriptional regulator [Acholeplasma sp. OttesenSCG-928-E16]
MKSALIKELVNEIIDSIPNYIVKSSLNALENFSGIKISKLQFSTFIILKHENGLSMKNLALRLGIIKQQLTRLVFNLEKEKLVKRIPNKDNKREVNVFITQKGLEVFGEVLENAFNRLSMQFINEDEAKLTSLLFHLKEINKILREVKETNTND